MLEPRSGSSDQRAGMANVGLKLETVSSAPRAGTANVSLKQKTCSLVSTVLSMKPLLHALLLLMVT